MADQTAWGSARGGICTAKGAIAMTKGATIKGSAFLAATLALIAAPAVTTRAPAQEIMLERVGAVRLAAPGELERNDGWLQKAFRNQARVAARDPIRVSSAPRADEGTPQPR
jgi:hypothetical protein